MIFNDWSKKMCRIKLNHHRLFPVLNGFALAYLISSFFFFGCSSKSESKSPSNSTKYEQYYVHGEQLYILHCSNCHQVSGTGLGLLYPPLSNSDFLKNNMAAVLCLMKQGKSGALTVNGKSFNKPMPGIPTLTDLEIAEIATYIYNAWGNQNGIIEVQEVSRILATCDQGL